MDIVTHDHYESALKKSINACPCRWWLQRYMVLTPVNLNTVSCKPGDMLDGWQMSRTDIASLLANGAIGIVETRPTGILTGVEEALAQAERLNSIGLQFNGFVEGLARAVYYGHADNRRISVWRAEECYFIHEYGVDDPDDATEHVSVDEVVMSLAFERMVSPKDGWRACFRRLL